MKFETINPMQWLAIDVANNFGMDKYTFAQRIEWVKQYFFVLETFTPQAKKQIAFAKAVKALRMASAGEIVHHPVGLDASSSGIQIMSALMRCRIGCENTNLIGNACNDAYQVGTRLYNEVNQTDQIFERDLVKKAIMTYYYGSVETPKKLFQTEENLDAFYEAMELLAPGANRLLQLLVSAWDSQAYEYEWTMPDGYEVYIPILESESQEMLHPQLSVPVTMIAMKQVNKEKSVSLAANMVHSIDAYILRSMVRRLHYNKGQTEKAFKLIEAEKVYRANNGKTIVTPGIDDRFLAKQKLFEYSQMVDVSIIPYLNKNSIRMLSIRHLEQLSQVMERMLSHKSFEVMTIHDDFRAHPNNVGRMADEYRQIMAELSNSNSLHFLLKQLGVNFKPAPNYIGHLIKYTQYALS
jgi:hypothetical protein